MPVGKYCESFLWYVIRKVPLIAHKSGNPKMAWLMADAV
jgi:hypothetical protein